MRVLRNLWLTGLGVWMAGVALTGARAAADVTTDRSGSIVIFPKVIADGTRDTLISLSNTSNTETIAHCFYVHGERFCGGTSDLCNVDSDCVSPALCEAPSWLEIDFDVILTRQQPTIWRVSSGRVGDLALGSGTGCDGECSSSGNSCSVNSDCTTSEFCRTSCPGFFLAENTSSSQTPANVPAQGSFRGELKCIQVDASGNPLSGDRLKGEATIQTLGSPQISEYNSINIRAVGGSSDLSLELNGSEYNACPDSVEFAHYADGASDVVAGGDVNTEVTFVPCTEDQEGVGITTPTRVPVQIDTWDEFETHNSASFILDCWTNLTLDQIAATTFESVTGTFRKTRIRPSSSLFCNRPMCRNNDDVCQTNDDCGPSSDPDAVCEARTCDDDGDCNANAICAPASGVLAVVEEFHENATGSTTNAVNTHMTGNRLGVCSNNLSTTCSSSSSCSGGGTCRNDRIVVPDSTP